MKILLLTHLKTSLKGKCESKLVYLARKQMWGSILRLLEENGVSALEDKGTASVHLTYDNHGGGNILHIMCEHHPPANVVNHVAGTFPLLTMQLNEQKQTPLHVAAAFGASPRIIATLLKHGGSSPARMRDAKGHTPLHLHIKHCTPTKQVCDAGYRQRADHGKKDKDWLVFGPDIKVLRQLAEAAPEAINMTDNEGNVPSDLAEGSQRKVKKESPGERFALAERRLSTIKQHIPKNEFAKFARRATWHKNITKDEFYFR
jgi:ankyrin repeat protein